MPKRTDVRLSEAKLCEIAGISQQQRQQLVRRLLLRPAPDAGCSVKDAIELAALLTVQEHLEASTARLAWAQLQPLLDGLIPSVPLEMVFDLRLGVLTLARTDGEVAAATRIAGPVQVVDLGKRLQEAGDAFRRWAEVLPFEPRQRQSRKNERSA
jgi:hypothetical protein